MFIWDHSLLSFLQPQGYAHVGPVKQPSSDVPNRPAGLAGLVLVDETLNWDQTGPETTL